MQRIAQPDYNEIPDLTWGEITSVDPIKIKVEGRFELTKEFIILGAMVKETWINIPEHDDNKHIHEMEESLGYLAGTGNMGAPVMFMMAGEPPFLPNPEYVDPTTTPDKEPTIPNPSFDPSTITPTPSLNLGHAHVIKPALPKIKLWRGLKVGDTVRMFRVGRGQLFYVFEREEGITNDSSE